MPGIPPFSLPGARCRVYVPAGTPVTERGVGFVTASVVDPFGNALGLMRNPHSLGVHAARYG
jgi:hypothetical protein